MDQVQSGMIEPERKLWLDATRGIGILLVMLSHSSIMIDELVSRLLTAGSVGMYFVVSGAVMNREKGVSLKKKAIRLLVPYFFYSIFLVIAVNVIHILLGGGKSDRLGLDFLGIFFSRFSLLPIEKEYNIFFLKCCNSPLWFLTAMFMSFICVAAYERIERMALKIILIIFWELLAVGLSFLPFLMPWSVDISVSTAILIIAGNKMQGWNLEKKEKKKLLLILLISLLIYIPLAIWNGAINISVRIYGDRGWASILAFGVISVLMTLIYGIICLLMEKTVIVKILGWLGKCSMTLLCTHIFIFFLINILAVSFIKSNLWITVFELAGALGVNAVIQHIKYSEAGKKWRLLQLL